MSRIAVAGGFGDDWERWLALLGTLAAFGLVPKAWRPALGTAGTVLAIYKILKRLGWL